MSEKELTIILDYNFFIKRIDQMLTHPRNIYYIYSEELRSIREKLFSNEQVTIKQRDRIMEIKRSTNN